MSSAASEPDHAADDAGVVSALRILVVDADDRTRESVAGILGIRHRFDVVGTAGRVDAAIDLARAHRPQVVVLDPRLPEVSDGMALIRRLRQVDPDVAILAVGWSPDLEHQALVAGADGFVRKTFRPGDLSTAIALCMDRRVAIDVARIAAAQADIARVKGEPALTLIDSAGTAAADEAVGAAPVPFPEPSRKPVATRGSGATL
jgi:DNA-binding NarL/FixJ family response regulator